MSRHPLIHVFAFGAPIVLGAALAVGQVNRTNPAAPQRPAAQQPQRAGQPGAQPAPAAPASTKPATPSTQPTTVDPIKVDQAIAKSVKWIYSKQKNGNWEEVPKATGNGNADVKGLQWGGLTSMATYGLLAAGESVQDPRMQQAVNFLANADIKGTYALGLRAQIWQYLPQNDVVRAAIVRERNLLMQSMRTQGESKGLYHYGKEGKGYDHSCSNYGVLGMWAIAATGLEIPTGYWEAVDEAWRRNQLPMGAWSYTNSDADKTEDHHNPRMSMTTAAVATLFITQEYLYGMAGVNCQGNIFDANIERGMRFIAQGVKRWDGGMYTMYNIERIGVASGYKYFGEVDWYHEGAARLLRSQKPDGSWGDLKETVWATLFLVRGRAPVMMNKLDYTSDVRGKIKVPFWNQRPRDVANIARWTGKQIEKNLNWQIVNLKANPNDFHDAPILYISGKEELTLNPPEAAKLKQFVENGGLILANADCDTKKFEDSFKKLGQSLFPYEFRPLPEEHIIYTGQQYKRETWKKKPQAIGMSNGVRELMILLPDDPAKGWQSQAFLGGEREPQAQLAANIFLYAVDKQNLRSKGDTYVVLPDPKISPKTTVPVARLEYAGEWDPEPAGWRRLAAILHNERQVKLDVQPVKLGTGKLSKTFKAAHLTGTSDLKLNDAQRQELKKYVEEGGTLIIDAAGGNPGFAAAAEGEINAIFGSKPAVLPISHKVFSQNKKIEEVEYRTFARKFVGNIRTPRLRGLDVNGRTAVYLSNEDLSAGLVGQPVDGINGYVPAAERGVEKPRMGATEIMGNLVLLAGNVAPPPPPKKDEKKDEMKDDKKEEKKEAPKK